MDWPPAKDKPERQRARISAMVKAIHPDCVATFDESWIGGTVIKFRVDNAESGRMVAGPSGEYESSEVADMSDQELERIIRSLPKRQPR